MFQHVLFDLLAIYLLKHLVVHFRKSITALACSAARVTLLVVVGQ